MNDSGSSSSSSSSNLGAMALESLECMTVESLSVHLRRSAVVLLLRVVCRGAVLMKERQLNNGKNSKHPIIIIVC